MALVEPDALSFPGARQAFDTRNIMTYKKDSKTARHTRIFVTSVTASKAGAARLEALARASGRWRTSTIGGATLFGASTDVGCATRMPLRGRSFVVQDWTKPSSSAWPLAQITACNC